MHECPFGMHDGSSGNEKPLAPRARVVHLNGVEDKEGRLVRVPAGASDHPADGHEEGHVIHLPSPSFWPLVAAVGLPVMAYGVLYSWWLVGAGALVAVVGFMGWAMEPPVAE